MKPDLKPHTQLTDEIRAKILKHNEGLTGTLHARATVLVRKFSFSRITIEKLIRHTVELSKPKKDVTEEERSTIRQMFLESTEENVTRKINHICKLTGRSPDLIRKTIRSGGYTLEGVKLFNYKQDFFI